MKFHTGVPSARRWMTPQNELAFLAAARELELSARGASQGCCNIPIVAAAETFTQISARDWVFCVKGWPPPKEVVIASFGPCAKNWLSRG